MKKIRKGDVVVVHDGWLIPSMESGCLGLVEQTGDPLSVLFAESSEIRYGTGKDKTTWYANSFLEVIDHIDEVPEPRVGDVAVYTNPTSEIQGALVIVTELDSVKGQHNTLGPTNALLVRIKWDYSSDYSSEWIHVNRFNKVFKIIDHVDGIEDPIPKLVDVREPAISQVSKNRYGVDVAYFRKELDCLKGTLDNRPPEELGRYLRRLSKVADPTYETSVSIPVPEPKQVANSMSITVGGEKYYIKESNLHDAVNLVCANCGHATATIDLQLIVEEAKKRRI